MRTLLLAAAFACFVILGLASNCRPTITQDSPGPLYKPNSPHKTEVCRDNGLSSLLRADDSFCTGPVCLRRRVVEPEHGIRLLVTGTVRDTDCKPIPDAVLDIWQTDSAGHYGSVHPGEQDGFCRAVVQADAHGKYEFVTDLPGTYGLLSGTFGSVDFPPFAPQHIHVATFAAGFKLAVTQLYWPDDPAIHHDWRASLAGSSLGSEAADLHIQLKPCTHKGKTINCAEADLVLERADSVTLFPSREAAIYDFMCTHGDGLSFALCNPQVVPYARVYILVPLALTALAIPVTLLIVVVRCLCSSRTAASTRTKRE
eukprot:TRINITY_DN7731_c0_g1_i1.p1 TRINITY_DN7731_c0_g1~~TRINITY_DN7731_c0_g1_i1.p1  ORF type:complete len:314 (+),score=33.93 TRINITY_DN7731_c0_g1_i1:67-1008(+)